jgi:hypothetical protein
MAKPLPQDSPDALDIWAGQKETRAAAVIRRSEAWDLRGDAVARQGVTEIKLKQLCPDSL